MRSKWPHHRRLVVGLAAPLFLLLACQDAPVAPGADAVSDAAFAKGGKPGKPGGGDPPPPADPAIIYATHLNKRVQGQRLGWSIHVMNADGTNQTRVLSNSEERGVESLTPHFSPDGTQFVFTREVYSVSPTRWEIGIANLDGSGLTTAVTPHPRYPRWSSVPLDDGEFKILFSGVNGPQYELFVANLDGSGLTQLTTTPPEWSLSFGAVWSRAADRVLATYWDQSASEFHVQLHSVSCVGGCQITSTVEVDLSAWISAGTEFVPRDWSNTGDLVVGETRIGGAGYADLWVLDLTNPVNPALTQVTATPGLDENHPTWSPDDSQIAYTAWPVDGDRSALVMNADGSGSQVIAEVGNEWGMDWIPTP